MRLTDRSLRALVLANTVALLVIGLGVAYLALRNKAVIHAKLRSFFDREAAASQLLGPERDGPLGELELPYPSWSIEIHPSDLRSIQGQVRQMLEAGAMLAEHKRWYPATFTQAGEKYDVKVRLKGDLSNHWSGAKKSWRVKFKKERLFQGRRYVDLNIPWDKGYAVEPVSYDVARELGLLVPDAGFCSVRINGVDFGAYLWMEKYGTEMLEKQGYAVGEIFRAQGIWIQTRFNGLSEPLREAEIPEYYYDTSNYDSAATDEPTVGYSAERFDRLVRLIRDADDATFAREIPHLLHLDRYAAWNALTWVFGSTHAHWGDNLRWYYDTTTGLFEPILYDVYRSPVRVPSTNARDTPRYKFEEAEHDRLARRLFRFPEHRQRRNEVLWRLVTDPALDVGRRFDQYSDALRQRFLVGVEAQDSSVIDRFQTETRTVLAQNRADLHALLGFARAFVTPRIGVRDDVSVMVLDVLPEARGFTALNGIRVDLAANVSTRAGAIRARVRSPDGAWTSVQPRLVETEGGGIELVFDDLQLWTPVTPHLGLDVAAWRVEVELSGLDAETWLRPGTVSGVAVEFSNTVSGERLADDYVVTGPIVFGLGGPLATPLTAPIETFVAGSDLPFTVDQRVVSLPAGTHAVRGTVTIPAGYTLRLEAGTELKMQPSASIVCYGPLDVAGTAARPVRVIAAQSDAPWGSLGVVRAGAVSRVRHLRVSGGSETRVHGIYLSGQLCFYSSDLDMQHCAIENGRADDGLNVKNAKVAVAHTLFRGNAADGFDADWVTGEIAACAFVENHGDGLDFSGSRAVVRDCIFRSMPDKGVSVGEATRLFIHNSVISGCAIGVASKDLSHVELRACVVHGNQTGVALYRKKQLFGGATANAVGCLFFANGVHAAPDGESKLEASHCGTDGWPAAEGVLLTELMSGDTQEFTTDELGRVRVPDEAAVGFRIVGPVEAERFEEFEAPALTGGTAGLHTALELDPVLLRRVRESGGR